MRRGEEESDNAEASTPAHFVIWFNKKDDGLISGIQKPSADGAASISGRVATNRGTIDERKNAPIGNYGRHAVKLPANSSATGYETDTARDGQTT